jgi:hypothetical protein
MAHQTTLKDSPGTAVNGILEGISGLGNNLTTLATLQARLAVEDSRESARRGLPALIAAGVLVPLAIASATVGLIGIGYWLAAARDVPLGRAFLIVALGGIVLSGSLAAFALTKLRQSLESFRRSREELERNIAWLRTVLAQSGR